MHGLWATRSLGLTNRMKCLECPCWSWPLYQRSLSPHGQSPHVFSPFSGWGTSWGQDVGQRGEIIVWGALLLQPNPPQIPLPV